MASSLTGCGFGGLPLPVRGAGGHDYPHHLRMQKHYRGSQPGQRTRSSSEPSKTTSLAAPLAALPGGREEKPPNAASGDPPTPLRPPPPGTDRPRARSHPALGLAVHCPGYCGARLSAPVPGQTLTAGRRGRAGYPLLPPPGSARCRCRGARPYALPAPGPAARATSGSAPLEKPAAYVNQVRMQKLCI